MSKSINSLLCENDSLCRQLAKLQARASELIQKRSAEVEQLTTVVEYLNSEIHQRDAMISFLQAKLREFRKTPELNSSNEYAADQFVCR